MTPPEAIDGRSTRAPVEPRAAGTPPVKRTLLPGGSLETLVNGRGTPVTVFAHGLASSIDETRPFASRVPGTRVFFHFRGHGETEIAGVDWSYAELARELGAVADGTGATRALGVSLGAGAVLRLAVDQPGRFDRIVLALPAAIDRRRADAAVARHVSLADLVDSGEAAALEAAVLDGEPEVVRGRPDARLWARRRAARLRAPGVGEALRQLAGRHPLRDRAELAHVTCPVLVVAQEGDLAHPAGVARELVSVLPDATLMVFDDGGLLWAHGREVRSVVADFLA